MRAAAGVPRTTTGLDVNKKVSGAERGLAEDLLGLAIGVVVLPASVHDNTASIAPLDQAVETPRPAPDRDEHRLPRHREHLQPAPGPGIPGPGTARTPDMPTAEAAVNITRSRLVRLLRQGFLTQPGRGRYQNQT